MTRDLRNRQFDSEATMDELGEAIGISLRESDDVDLPSSGDDELDDTDEDDE